MWFLQFFVQNKIEKTSRGIGVSTRNEYHVTAHTYELSWVGLVTNIKMKENLETSLKYVSANEKAAFPVLHLYCNRSVCLHKVRSLWYS